MDRNSGICERLMKFIFSMLRGSTHQVPIQEGSSRKPINNGISDSEIVVEFRHTDGSETWTRTTNERGNSIRARRKNGLMVSSDDDQIIVQNGLDHKSVTIKGSDQVNNHHQPHEEVKPLPTRPHWPLLSVASDINEKSDAFIESRKKSMSRNDTLDSDKS